MSLPRYSAEFSLYNTSSQYRATSVHGDHLGNSIVLAGGRTWGGDPCDYCAHLSGCRKARCYCTCDGGIAIPSALGPCGFLCA
jgi:hypothetical protein